MLKDRIGIILLGFCLAIAMGAVFYNSLMN